ncbi:MAG: hypothetical protein HZA54_03005, partial [Planctomycetes bacterium]|nr:hypothetical protein [Planctomycetota bacterium]
AVERLGEFLKQNARHREGHLRRAQGLLRFGNAPEALKECDAALEGAGSAPAGGGGTAGAAGASAPSSGTDLILLLAYCVRAEARLATKDAAGADGDLAAALGLNAKFGTALLVRAQANVAAGRDAAALADFEAALASGIRRSDILLARGRYRVAKGELELAQEDFYSAAQLAQPTGEPYAELGLLQLKRGDLERAILYLERALKAAPKSGRADELRAQLTAAKQRRDAEAIPLTKGKEYQRRGDEWINKKQYEFAEKDYQKAVELDAQLDGAWYNLACIYSLWGQLDKSLAHLRKAFETGFKDFDWAGKDSDLDNLRKDARYGELIKEFGGKTK